MGASASSCLHRHRGYEPIPRHEEEEEMWIPRPGYDEEQKKKKEQEVDDDILVFEEERQGPAALEARGRMLRERARRQGTVFATWKDLKDSALCYLLALNWRKAALGFVEQAMYELHLGNQRRAGTAFLRSAKCYIQIENKREYEVAYVKQALDKATALFARTGELRLAAASCQELADFYMDQQDLRGALAAFKRAAAYCACGGGGAHGHCGYMADVVRLLLRDEEALRRRGVLPLKDYKRRSDGYIRSSDPEWRSKVSELYHSTFHDSIGRTVDLIASEKGATDHTSPASMRHQSAAVRLLSYLVTII